MTRTTGWAAISVAVVLGMAGCGSDDTGSASGAPPAVSGAAGEPDPVAVDPTATGPSATVPAPSEPMATTGASTDSGESPSADLCAALDAVDLDGLLGEPAGTPESEEDDFGGVCIVAALDPDSRGTVSLRVSANAAAANYENAREQFGVDAEIAGLGDGAFASGPMVTVLAGDRLVSLQTVRWRDLGIGGGHTT